MIQSAASAIPRDSSTELAECGWSIEEVVQPNGSIQTVQVPLSEAEFLHPQEGFHLPNTTFHNDIAGAAKDMLTRRYANHPDVGVFRDLLIKWDIELGDHCPDTFVAFGIRDKQQNRAAFEVVQEGVRPTLIIEVVSPRYRKTDRETKVVQYAQAGVQEYVILDRRRYRKQTLDEVLGYRLVDGHYQPLTPDDDGRILCQTIGVWISLQEQLVMEDAETGKRLMTSLELEAANQALEAANQALEQQASEMAALLARYQGQFGELPGNDSQ